MAWTPARSFESSVLAANSKIGCRGRFLEDVVAKAKEARAGAGILGGERNRNTGYYSPVSLYRVPCPPNILQC
jgi:hypothetical protein